MKEVFAQHQQEQEDLIETYYNEMYKVAHTIGVEKSKVKEIINQTKKEIHVIEKITKKK